MIIIVLILIILALLFLILCFQINWNRKVKLLKQNGYKEYYSCATGYFSEQDLTFFSDEQIENMSYSELKRRLNEQNII